MNQLKFNLVYKKVLSQESASKNDYCNSLANILSHKMPSLDAAKVLELVKQRNSELQLAINNTNFSLLKIEEPSNDEVEDALKHQKKGESADAFKIKYERLQSLLKKMN